MLPLGPAMALAPLLNLPSLRYRSITPRYDDAGAEVSCTMSPRFQREKPLFPTHECRLRHQCGYFPEGSYLPHGAPTYPYEANLYRGRVGRGQNAESASNRSTWLLSKAFQNLAVSSMWLYHARECQYLVLSTPTGGSTATAATWRSRSRPSPVALRMATVVTSFDGAKTGVASP